MGNQQYQQYKEAGLCRRCGSEPLLGKTRCKKCHEEHLNYTQKWRKEAIAAGLCRYCCVIPRTSDSSMCAGCLALHAKRQQNSHLLYRAACIEHYGGKCACCSLDVHKYLQLDHINNDGAAHRRGLYGRATNLYLWAFRNGFPEILQLLCANCHQAKTYHGGCTTEDHRQMIEVGLLWA